MLISSRPSVAVLPDTSMPFTLIRGSWCRIASETKSRTRPINPWLSSPNRNSLNSQPKSSCMTRSPRRVVRRIARLCSMSSMPDTVWTSSPPAAKAGGKFHPVPRNEGSSGMALRLPRRSGLDTGTVGPDLLGCLLLNPANQRIDLGELEISQRFQNQIDVVDRQLQLDLLHWPILYFRVDG